MEELSLHILDLAQNSIAAGAGLVEITVDEQPAEGTLSVTVRDDGRGMPPECLRQAADPFYTTRSTRGVGLGLPLFRMAAEQTGGSFAITSSVGGGTEVRGVFLLSSIDLMPLGDMDGTILLLTRCNPALDIVYTHIRGEKDFRLDTRPVRAALGGIPLNEREPDAFLRSFLAEGESKLEGGVSS